MGILSLRESARRRRRPCSGQGLGEPLGVHQLPADGVARGLEATRHAELFKQVGDVGFDGLLANGEPLCNLRVPESLSHKPQHLKLARREVDIAVR